jgi:hypothetical protein
VVCFAGIVIGNGLRVCLLGRSLWCFGVGKVCFAGIVIGNGLGVCLLGFVVVLWRRQGVFAGIVIGNGLGVCLLGRSLWCFG